MASSYTLIAGAVVSDGAGRVVLVQENRPRIQGLWNLPTGRVEEGEHPRETAEREVKEEAGIDIAAHAPIGVYVKPSDTTGIVCAVIYWATTRDDRPVLEPSDVDIAAAEWAEVDAIREYDLRSSHITQAVEDGRNGKRISSDRIRRFDRA